MKKYLIIGGIILIAGVFFYLYREQPVEGSVQIVSGEVIGTRVGTTTTGVAFYGNYTATSTYYATTTNAETIMLTLKATKASSTPSGGLHFSLYGSNDYNCMTGTTTLNANGGANQILRSEINWYDVGSHVAELAGSQTLSSATSTFVWSPLGDSTKDVTLVNMNYQCLKVEASGSSTELMMQLKARSTF